ncbi:hypothetical protein HN680_01140, partial [Candidatus Peregrinibacteria bacterium]|nr:hypothetical protein [Candidatus Peregrinibacteria bacterium]
EGEKVALEELIPILDRPDSGGVSNRVEESSVDEESKEKDIPTDAVPIPEEKEGDADPNHIDLPEGFAPPENLQSLSNDLPKVSAALPGDGTLEEKDSIKVSHKGREEGVALSDRPHQMLVDLGEEQAELEEDNPMDMLPDGIKAPQAPQKGPAGQQQQKQKDAEKEAAKKQQKNVDDQLKKSEEDGEKEDEQKPNRVNNNSFRSGGGKGILRKAAPWAVGGGIGLGMASPFALNSLSASAHYEPLLSLISILV